MGTKRNRQVADLIRREVAMLIKTSINDPRLSSMMIITVDLSPDLKNARIFYTVSEDVVKEEAAAALKKAAGFIRHELSVRAKLRHTPQLHFVYDESIARAQHLLSLMKDFKAEGDD